MQLCVYYFLNINAQSCMQTRMHTRTHAHTHTHTIMSSEEQHSILGTKGITQVQSLY